MTTSYPHDHDPAADLEPALDPTAAETTINSLIASVTALDTEKAELKDRLLRTLADMENLRRRTEKDVADAKLYAVTGFARDMVGAADNLARALQNLPAEVRVAADPAIQSMVDGVELTERDLIKTLGRYGVKKLDPLGQKFDPNLHQAMFEAPDNVIVKGAVMQVVQTGFTIGERVLRPALVGVSTGLAAPNPLDNPQV